MAEGRSESSASAAGQASYELLRAVFETVGAAVWIEDHAGIVVAANPAAEALLGAARGGLVGTPLSDRLGAVVHLDASPWPEAEHPVAAVRATGQAQRGEVMGIPCAGGELRWFIVDAEPFTLPEGGPAGVLVAMRDISDAVHAQIRLQALMDAAPVAIWSFTADQQAVSMNDRGFELSGMTREEWLSGGWQRAEHPDDSARIAAAWDAMVAGGPPFDLEYRVTNQTTGREHTIRERARLVHGIAGVGVVGITDDISDRVQAEAERSEALERLREREALLTSILDSVSDSVIVRDADGEAILRNAVGDDVPRLSSTDLAGLGGSPPQDAVLHEDGREMVLEVHPVHRVLQTGEPVRGAVLGVAMPDGSRRWSSVNAVPLELPGDGRHGVVATYTDITERLLAVREAQAAQQRLEAVINAVPVAVWAYGDELHDAVAPGDRWFKMTGQPWSESQGDGWLNLIHPDDRPRVELAWQRTQHERTPFEVQYRIRRFDTGEERIFSERGAFVDGVEGVCIVGAVQDVTTRVQAEAAVEELATEQAALRGIAEIVARHSPLPEVFERSAAESARLADARDAWVLQFEPAGSGTVVGMYSDNPAASTYIGLPVDLAAQSASAEVLRTGGPVRTRSQPDGGALGPEFHDRLAVPLRVGGRLWGALAVAVKEGGTIAEAAEGRLAAVAELVSLAITQAESRERAARAALMQAEINRLGGLAVAAAPLDRLFTEAASIIATVFAACSVEIREHAPKGGPARVRAAVGAEAPGASAENAEIRLADGPWGEIAASGSPIDGAPRDEIVRGLTSVANILGGAIQRARDESLLRHQALHDSLTGIPNRRHFRRRFEEALAALPGAADRIAVIALSLDHFKIVNVTSGPAAADSLLRAVAARLVATAGPDAFVARLGGDHFGVIATGASTEAEARSLAESLLQALLNRDREGGALSAATAGFALRGRGDAAEDAVRDADTALYRAKAEARGQVRMFDESMRSLLVARRDTEQELLAALDGDELSLSYQPVVSLDDGAILSLEALVRWQHPTRGALGPSEFIQIAEETGVILPLGRWSLERACRDLAHLHRLHPGHAALRVSVNVSARQLADDRLSDHVRACLEANGLDPALLGLELTETALLDRNQVHAERLHRLKALGVQLLLDDFGTGYSSLGYVQGFPLDTLKLDRSLVTVLGQDERRSAITGAIVQMADALGLGVVAEGVEDKRQFAALRALGCTQAQGYLIARPLVLAKVDQLLAGAPPWLTGARAAMFTDAAE